MPTRGNQSEQGRGRGSSQMGRRGFGWFNRERDRWSEDEDNFTMFGSDDESGEEQFDYSSSPEGTRGQGSQRRFQQHNPGRSGRGFGGQENPESQYGQGRARGGWSQGMSQEDRYGQSWDQSQSEQGRARRGWNQGESSQGSNWSDRQHDSARFGQGGYGYGGQEEFGDYDFGDSGRGSGYGRGEGNRFGQGLDQQQTGPYGQGDVGRQQRGSSHGHFGQSRTFGGESRQSFGGGEQRGSQSFRGRGPRDYQRSDDRIRDEICDCLTDDHYLDASNITVKVSQGEVRLSGHVDSREAKRRAEDLAERISGATDVINELRVQRDNQWGRDQHSQPEVQNRQAPTVSGSQATAAGTTGQTGTTAHVGGQTGQSNQAERGTTNTEEDRGSRNRSK